MTSAELEELIARYFEGDLDAAGEARLDELLAADPAAFERFKGLVGVEGLLRARSADADARADLEGRVAESVRLEERRRRLTSRVMESLHERRARAARSSGSSAGWWAAGIAAAVFLAVLVVVATRPGASPRAEREAVRNEPERPTLPTPEPPKAPERRPEPSRPPVRTPEPRPEVPSVPVPTPPEPKPEEPKPPAPVPKPEVEIPRTVVAVADLPVADGNVFIVARAERKPVSSKQLLAGQGIETGAEGRAVLQWTDGTRAELGAASELREVQDREPAGPGRKARGRRLQLVRGSVLLGVSRQPADQPMVVATPHGEARVVGTAFRVTIAKGATQLEVTEGKVRFTRARDGKSADAGAGQALVSEPDLSLKPLHPEEIVLHARDGRIVGDEWKLVPDRRASAGAALEAQGTTAQLADHPSKRPSYVEFSFWATAGREYRVWVRGASQPTGDPWTRDFLVLASAGAEWNHKCRFFGTSGEVATMTAGFSKFSGYGWIGGFVENPAAEPPPLTVKFATSGPQTFRVYVAHPSIRVDAVWLSATQTSKPPVKQVPPATDR